MARPELETGQSRLTGARRYRTVRHWFRTLLVLEVQYEFYTGYSTVTQWRTARAQDLEQGVDVVI